MKKHVITSAAAIVVSLAGFYGCADPAPIKYVYVGGATATDSTGNGGPQPAVTLMPTGTTVEVPTDQNGGVMLQDAFLCGPQVSALTGAGAWVHSDLTSDGFCEKLNAIVATLSGGAEGTPVASLWYLERSEIDGTVTAHFQEVLGAWVGSPSQEWLPLAWRCHDPGAEAVPPKTPSAWLFVVSVEGSDCPIEVIGFEICHTVGVTEPIPEAQYLNVFDKCVP